MLLLSFQSFRKVFAQKASGSTPVTLCSVKASLFSFGIRLVFVYLSVFFYMMCSNKFKSFSYLYDEEQFISFLKNDVVIAKTLPENLKAARKRNEFPLFKPKNSASTKFYLEDVLPKLKKAGAIGLVVSDGGCLQVMRGFACMQ